MLKNYQNAWLLILTCSLLFVLGSVLLQKMSPFYSFALTPYSNETWFQFLKKPFLSQKNSFLLRFLKGERPVSPYGNMKNYLPPEQTTSDKYMIYRCSSRACGGLADRQKGIITSYVLSQMLRRKFGIIMNKGCEFSKFVIPNHVNWLVNETALKGRSKQEFYCVDDMNAGIRMSNSDIEKMFPKDVTYYEGNYDYLPFLMNKTLFASVSWAQNYSHYDLYRIAFSHLFKLAPNTQRRYEKYREKIKNQSLICAHVRKGKSKNIPTDINLSYKHPDTKSVIQFLKEKLTNITKLFLATDSDDVRQEVRVAFPDHFTELEGSIAHIDRFGGKLNCSGMEKAILDQFILSTCDTFLMSYSGFSIVAALLRGSDDNLYLARLKNITQIKRLHPLYTFEG